MSLQLIISVILLIFICGLIIWFVIKTERLKTEHRKAISSLEGSIFNHNRQIAYRKLKLEHYDFLAYNLKDALIVQPNILL